MPSKPDITYYWIRFVRDVLRGEGTYLTSSGRKYISGNTYLEIPGPAWARGFEPTLQDLAYGNRSTKFSQLTKTYLDKEAAAQAVVKMQTRVKKKADFTSIAFSTFHGEKGKRSQGHCMNSIVLTYIPKSADGKSLYYIDIHYRQTEVIKKFAADLIFLSQVVVPMLTVEGIPLTAVRFYFSNVFFSCLFSSILYPWISPQRLWKWIQDNPGRPQDKSFQKACTRYIFWPLENNNPNTYNFKSRQKMHALALHYLNNGVVNRESLESLYLDIKSSL